MLPLIILFVLYVKSLKVASEDSASATDDLVWVAEFLTWTIKMAQQQKSPNVFRDQTQKGH